jgi:hypothetical protein
MASACFGNKAAAPSGYCCGVRGSLGNRRNLKLEHWGWQRDGTADAIAVACLRHFRRHDDLRGRAGSSAAGTFLRALTAAVLFPSGAAFAVEIATVESAATKAATSAKFFIFIMWVSVFSRSL